MKPPRVPLPELLATLRRGAVISGADRAQQLSHGARVAWRERGGVVTFAVSRPHARLGDTELIVFKAAAAVPPDAARIPGEGQEELTIDGVTWHRVAWRWYLEA